MPVFSAVRFTVPAVLFSQRTGSFSLRKIIIILQQDQYLRKLEHYCGERGQNVSAGDTKNGSGNQFLYALPSANASRPNSRRSAVR